MPGGDKRQTQDDRTFERDPTEDAREEYTTYRETDPDRASSEDEAARREADLQPAPSREESDDQSSSRRSGG